MHILQLFQGDIKAFPSQPRDITSPVSPWSALRHLPSGTCLKHIPWEASRHPGKLPYQMPKPPKL